MGISICTSVRSCMRAGTALAIMPGAVPGAGSPAFAQPAAAATDGAAGDINFIARKPGNEVRGRAAFSFGEDGLRELSGHVCAPVIRHRLHAEINGRVWRFGGWYRILADPGEKLGREKSNAVGLTLRAKVHDAITEGHRQSLTAFSAAASASSSSIRLGRSSARPSPRSKVGERSASNSASPSTSACSARSPGLRGLSAPSCASSRLRAAIAGSTGVVVFSPNSPTSAEEESMPLWFVNWDRRPAVFGTDASGATLAFASLDGKSWERVDADDVASTAGIMPESDWRARFNPPAFSGEARRFAESAAA